MNRNNHSVCLRSCVLLLVIMALSLAGCTNIPARYSVSSSNALSLRSLHSQASKQLRVGQFKGEKQSVMCRAFNPLSPPDNATFASFIGGAFKDEFIIANVYTENSPIELTGRLINIDMDSAGMTTGRWTIEMEMAVPESPPFVVKTVYPFKSGFAAYTVCENARNALVPAVQEFVKSVISHPTFRGVFST